MKRITLHNFNFQKSTNMIHHIKRQKGKKVYDNFNRYRKYTL